MRLIDADELLKAPFRITGKFGGKYPFEAITIKMVEAAPTIDPIRAAGGCYCRECKRCDGFQGHNPDPEEVGVCHIDMMMVSPNDFCSHSEPREGQDDG